ncbi:MAG: hypothetical protein KGO92_14015, partial [Bacteroidota bacterium]|nr:hypothetical protein [Bacteroidota bacterium]
MSKERRLPAVGEVKKEAAGFKNQTKPNHESERECAASSKYHRRLFVTVFQTSASSNLSNSFFSVSYPLYDLPGIQYFIASLNLIQYF